MTETAGQSPAAADSKAERSMKKCDQCRAKKIKCSPVDRKWPEDGKCEACKKADLPCGPNLRKQTASASVADAGNRTASPAGSVTDEQSHTGNRRRIEAVLEGQSQYDQIRPNTGLERDATPGRLSRGLGQDIQMRESSPLVPIVAPIVQRRQRFGDTDNAPLQMGPSRASSPRKRAPEGAFENRVYKYTDVSKGGFRLLKLSPGSTGPLRGSLTRVDSSQATESSQVPYEALSYAWGSDAVTSVIEIHIGDHVSQMPITPGLEIALKYLRSSQNERIIWVDQICINQTNTTEKSAQVVRMGQIYRNAERVVVWLGDEDFDTAKATTFARRTFEIELFESLLQDPQYREERLALLRLLQRPWFKRRWVIQEVALARDVTVRCGRHTVSWDCLSTMISMFTCQGGEVREKTKSSGMLNTHPDFVGAFRDLPAVRLFEVTSNLLRRDRLNVRPLLSLETLVSSLQHFESSNFHDTFYALLSLASDVSEKQWSNPSKRLHIENENEVDGFVRIDSLDIDILPEKDAERLSPVVLRWRKILQERTYPVDYTKTIYAVCKDFLLWTLKTSRSIDIICQSWAPTKSPEQLPSWMPSLAGLSFRRNGKGLLRRVRADPLVALSDGRKNYNASSRAPAKCSFGIGSNEGVLSVEGFMLDVIKVKKLPAQSGNVPSEWLAVAGWTDTKQLPPDAFWRTLVADRGFGQNNPPSYYPLACRQAYAMGVDGDDLKTDAQERCPRLVEEFLRRVQSVVWQRCLVVTEDENMLGLVPYDANPRDLICILYGCSVPVVLRRYAETSTGNAYHQLIGECYIHSMMDGSAFRLRDKKLAEAKKLEPELDSLTETFHLK